MFPVLIVLLIHSRFVILRLIYQLPPARHIGFAKVALKLVEILGHCSAGLLLLVLGFLNQFISELLVGVNMDFELHSA